MKRILVCGGRDYGRLDPRRVLEHPKRRAEARKVRETLTSLRLTYGPFVLIHGGAKGADSIAGSWAEQFHAAGEPAPLVFEADWSNLNHSNAVVKRTKAGKVYDAMAGLRRNTRMIVEGKPDLVVAFPGGTGTANMVAQARTAKIEVMEIE